MPHGPVVICDPGVDDAVALMVLAGAADPPSAVIGTAGNVGAALAYRNAAGIVDLLGLRCPVAAGTDAGLRNPYPDAGKPFHGPDGMGGLGSLLPPERHDPPDPLTLVRGEILATGPLSLVAHALDAQCPIDSIVWMGGAVACGGNMSASAEFNAWLDPEAADRALCSGIPFAMVPLDVTHQLAFDARDIATMAKLGSLPSLAARSCSFICDRDGLIYLHDAVAAVAHLQPGLFGWEEHWVRCERNGEWTRGMTVVDRRDRGESGSVRVATRMHAGAVKECILESLRSLG